MGFQPTHSPRSKRTLLFSPARDSLFERPGPKLAFFVDGLGFNLILDHRVPEWGRFVVVAPPDGTARLALVAPKPDSENYPFIGKSRGIVFLTEDVRAKYEEWKKRRRLP